VSKRQLRSFRTGCALWILTGLLQAAGYFVGRPDPSGEEQAALFSLFDGLAIPMGGVSRTLGQVYDGYSLSFALLVFLLGFLGFLWLRIPGAPDSILRRVAGMNAVGALALFLVGLPRFPVPPLACFAAVAIAFALAAWPARVAASA